MEEIKKILAYFEIPDEVHDALIKDEKKAEEILSEVSKKWIPRKMAVEDPDIKKTIESSFGGGIEQKVKKNFNLETKETEGKRLYEVIDLAKQKVDTQMAELNTKLTELSKNSSDENVKKLSSEVETWKGKYSELEGVFNTTKQTLTEKEANFNNQMKSFKINTKLNELKASMPFTEMDDVYKEGLEFRLSKKMKFDLDEKEELQVFDEHGNKIKNTNGTDFLNAKDALTKFYADNNALKMNNTGTSPKNRYEPENKNGLPKEKKLGELGVHPDFKY